MKDITVIFPMAGKGQRFGSKFKPFLRIFNKTFLELAVQPFLKHRQQIKKFVFIVREDHYHKFNVAQKIGEFHLSIPFTVKIIPETENAVETISYLFEDDPVLENVIFCDCDHSINIDPLFNEINKEEYDCIIPGWEIYIPEKNWSIACVNDNNIIKDITEKKVPNIFGKYYGVIGCYYFKKLNKPPPEYSYISEIVKSFIDKEVKLVIITEAEFFGDPERLKHLYELKNSSTVFCDLDGTLIKHENIPNYTKNIELLPGAKEKIEEWRNNHIFIVLVTSRDEQFREEMERMLFSLGLKYEYLIMGLPPGPRYIINDKKPYSDISMVGSYEVIRDVGIKNIEKL
jgi:hypothetical protein